MDVEDSQWMEKGPWYNKTIRFEDYFRTGCKDRYELIFYLDVYDKEYVSMPYDASSAGGIPMQSMLYKEAL